MRLRSLKLGIGCLALLVLLPPALWVYWDITSGRQLQADLEALRAQGMPVTSAELAHKPVPDAQNAAVLYQQVFQLSFTPGPGFGIGRLIGGLSSADHQMLFGYFKEGNRQLTPAIREVLQQASVQNDLETLRRAAERPYCVFPIDWAAGFSGLYPHFMSLRDAAMVLAVQTHLCAEEGDIAGALSWSKVSLRMSRHIGSEPTLIAQLVALTLDAIALKSVRQNILPRRVPPAAAADFERYLRGVDMNESLEQAVIGERAMALDLFGMAFSQGPRELFSSGGLLGQPWDALYFNRLCRPLPNLDEMICLDTMAKQIALADLPYRTAGPKLTALKTDLESRPPWQGIVTRFLTSPMGIAWRKRDRTMAEIGLCRIALLLKNYQYTRGAYPSNLRQLQVTVDCALPEDPFTGKAFVYQRVGHGFRLYSFGPDMDDDGGLSTEQLGRGYEDGDLVWECDK